MRRTFSDNWYRVADLRLGLRAGVSIRLHHYRGEPWYVLHERAHGGFFRVNPTTYRFLARIGVEATLDEIWRAAVDAAPEETPGQEEVFELVVALYRANLIHVEGGVDETKIVERFARKKKKPLLARLSELLFLRVPLWDPDAFLTRRRRAIDLLFSGPALLAAALVVAWGAIELVLAGARAQAQAEHILQLDNVALLYLAIFASHFLHEMAHAAACKHFGGEVRTMGVMLLMLTPLPYVDLSSSWAFRDGRRRALVDAAGMLMDVAVGGAAAIVWAYSPPGAVNELAYNLMFSTAVYTLVFNINPLMRFDGYYILADLIEIPNLHEQAREQFLRFWRARILGLPADGEEATSRRRRAGLLAFFVASSLYRLFVMAGIVLFVADQYFGIGLVAAAALALSSFVVPAQRLLAPLRSPLFRYQNQRFLRRAGYAAAVVLVALLALPLPDGQVLDGVVEAGVNVPVHSESGGIVEDPGRLSGQWVERGDVLAVLANPELDADLAAVAAQLTQAQVQESKATVEGGVDLSPIRERLRTLDALQASLARQREALTVRAPHAGVWVAPETPYRRGSWVARGAELGRIVDDRSHVFLGVIRQEAAVALGDLRAAGSRVRVEGERDRLHEVAQLSLVPHSQSTLPSVALSPLAGGSIPVRTGEAGGQQAAEPFFLLRAELAQENGRQAGAAFRSGRSGWIRLRLPARPLAFQVWRSVTQFFQRRYQL